MISNTTSHFRRDLLPLPAAFYSEALGGLSRPSQGWVRTNCPFHESRSKKSFSINLDSGAYHCFGCGKSGGDIIRFIMERDGIDFVSAAKKLGCWDSKAKPQPSRQVIVGVDLVCDFIIDGTPYSARVKDDARSWLDCLRRIYHRANDRLTELSRGDAEKFDGEAENCWALMSDCLPQIRAEAGQ